MYKYSQSVFEDAVCVLHITALVHHCFALKSKGKGLVLKECEWGQKDVWIVYMAVLQH